jgi:hypothetical protein
MKFLNSKIIPSCIFLAICSNQIISAQSEKIVTKDSNIIQQKDIIDLFQKVFNKQSRKDALLCLSSPQ